MLRLRYLGTRTPLAVDGLTPDRLAGQSLAAIAGLPVSCGNAVAPLGDFFAVSGEASDQDILLEGDCRLVKAVGARMASGRITVNGDVGLHAGAGMTGGELHVQGRAGDWLGAEMRGGRIHVHGDAGHQVGSVYPGGQVGEEIGSNMRRGLLAVAGDCGDFAGCGMIAGSIFVFGRMGRRPGAGMKRGSILCAAPPPLLPTFRFDCTFRPVFLTLYLNQLRVWGFPVPQAAHRGDWRRYSGDLVALGKGEFLTRA
jgi:formylmethanofuran dehydrogenase subunit C